MAECGCDSDLVAPALKALQKITGKNLNDDQQAWEAYVAGERERAAALEANRIDRSKGTSLLWWR